MPAATGGNYSRYGSVELLHEGCFVVLDELELGSLYIHVPELEPKRTRRDFGNYNPISFATEKPPHETLAELGNLTNPHQLAWA